MSNKTQTLSTKLPLDVVERIKDAAAIEGTTASGWVAAAIYKCLGDEPNERKVNSSVDLVDPILQRLSAIEERLDLLEKSRQSLPKVDRPVDNTQPRSLPKVDRLVDSESIASARQELMARLGGKPSLSSATVQRVAHTYGTTADKLAEAVGWVKTGRRNRAIYAPDASPL